MCGIVGYIGRRDVAPLLLEGLQRLEYRGYDSAGVVITGKSGDLKMVKAKGRVRDLEARVPKRFAGTTGIAHTRWATHGAHGGPALKSAIARRIRPEVRISGKFPGAKIKAFKTPNVRGFANAAKRTNRSSGWRHPVYGNREVWIQQHGPLKWFDRAFEGEEGRYKRVSGPATAA